MQPQIYIVLFLAIWELSAFLSWIWVFPYNNYCSNTGKCTCMLSRLRQLNYQVNLKTLCDMDNSFCAFPLYRQINPDLLWTSLRAVVLERCNTVTSMENLRFLEIYHKSESNGLIIIHVKNWHGLLTDIHICKTLGRDKINGLFYINL